MKVKDLIQQLRHCDPEARVVVDGYEGGVDDVDLPRNTMIALDVYTGSDIYGAHSQIKYMALKTITLYEVVNAVYLPGKQTID